MDRIRKLHLYLGCIFAPLLIFFAISGAWQTFMLHVSTKPPHEYYAPLLLQRLSSIHKFQDFSLPWQKQQPSIPFRCFVLGMALGFVSTAILGVVMAFKFTRERWIVWLCLAAGFILPVFLLYVGGGIR